MLNILNILAMRYIIPYYMTVRRSELEEFEVVREIVCDTFGCACLGYKLADFLVLLAGLCCWFIVVGLFIQRLILHKS